MKVFVSSTSEDLGPFRQAARDVILDLGWQPEMMEHFGAEGSPGILDACARRLEGCDAVLAILAWRRGEVTAGEIETAGRRSLPVLVLMARETWPGHLWAESDEDRAWVRRFRQGLDRIALFFDWEEVQIGTKEHLPVFRAKVREALVQHMLRIAARQKGAPAPAWRLPARPPHCFGREDEVEEVVTALLTSPPLPVPILGPGGAGKSTIALTALHDSRVAARYGERRFFVRCDTAMRRAALVGEIARTLGLEPGPDPEGKLLAELECAPAVLVLDNAETPWWGSDTEAVEELLVELAAVPGLALTVTLRGDQRPGGPAWRQALRLGALPLPAAREAFLAVAGELYRDDPDLDPLLEGVDRLAIAVVLLAHQAEGESRLAALRRRWQEERTALLRRGQGRLTNLEVSLELSIGSRRMTEGAKRLLAVLALLPDGIAREGDLPALLPQGAEAAAAVLRQVGLAFWQGERLRALAPVREHVRQRHPPPPEDLERAVDIYRDVARLGGKVGTEGGAEAAARVAAELGNVQAMLLQGLKRSEPGAAIEAACHLGELLRFTGLGTPEVLEQARRTAREHGETGLEARCARSLGDVAMSRSDHDAARSLYDEALALYQGIGDLLGEAKCIERLGTFALRRSDHAAARALYERALPLFRRTGDLSGEANCLQSLGDIALDRSDYETARALYEQALPIFQRSGSLRGEANCIWRLGDIALRRSDHDGARALYEQALPLYRRVGSLLGEANCTKGLGDIAFRQIDHTAARALYEQALPLYRRIADLLGEANCLQGLGDIALGMSDPATACSLYEQALALHEKFGDPYSIGRAHVAIARACLDPEERRRRVVAAREAWLSIQRPDLVEKWLKELGQEAIP